MSILRVILVFLIMILPLGVSAQSGLLDPSATLAELQLLIAQYEARLKKAESENAILRYQMAQAGIQIPLGDFSGATTAIPTVLPVVPAKTLTGVIVAVPQTSIVTNTNLSDITKKYGKDPAGFISQIQKDWTNIKSNYKFPPLARLAGYEFVNSGLNDFVFVDIIVGTGTTGVYDIKILYQFEMATYKRKVIGIFDYSPTTSRYTTRTGSNPFGGVARTFIKDPYYAGVIEIPATAITPPVNSGSTGVILPPTGVGPSIAEITKAYNDKRYLSTISLSNAYLTTNTPTQEILNIRYRTYFIIGKYAESLAELAKIEKITSIDKQTACNAQVIATYSKNQALIDKYAALCKK